MSELAKETVTVLLCGVGGQGTILAADLLAHSAQAAGWQVKLSEVHGMSQRGGAVTTVVRFGDEVASMVTDPGCADYILAFETTEALRNLAYLKAGGGLYVSDTTIKPSTVLTGQAEMPKDVTNSLLEAGARLVPADRLAGQAGNVKASNVVMLGVLAKELGMASPLWEGQIASRLPNHLAAVNILAFRAGFSFQV
ncbi:MAG: indolepyruvate oxidoreductase subunit beta [Micrococcales bacterium]|nr:indolepyruvate oxidoreductase subunit beta [Micrococcales bacterium]